LNLFFPENAGQTYFRNCWKNPANRKKIIRWGKGTEEQRGDRVKTYRDLVVWQKSVVLVTEVYEISKKFPKDELYGLSLNLSAFSFCASNTSPITQEVVL